MVEESGQNTYPGLSSFSVSDLIKYPLILKASEIRSSLHASAAVLIFLYHFTYVFIV